MPLSPCKKKRANWLARVAPALRGVARLLSWNSQSARIAVKTQVQWGSRHMDAVIRLRPGPRVSGTATEGQQVRWV